MKQCGTYPPAVLLFFRRVVTPLQTKLCLSGSIFIPTCQSFLPEKKTGPSLRSHIMIPWTVMASTLFTLACWVVGNVTQITNYSNCLLNSVT